MPMLPLHVGWCLPLPIPSSNIALPTQKLTSYPTLKLTTHMLPDPKTQQKTHNPQESKGNIKFKDFTLISRFPTESKNQFYLALIYFLSLLVAWDGSVEAYVSCHAT